MHKRLPQKQIKRLPSEKLYIFPVVLEDDDDVWRVYVPGLEEKGAATWGKTKEEALKNIQEVAQMIIEELIEDDMPIPKGAAVFNRPVVAVTA